MKGADRREVVKVDHAPAVELVPVTPWRDALTVDDLATIRHAQDYADFWQGVQNNDVRILVTKLVNMLDGKHG